MSVLQWRGKILKHRVMKNNKLLFLLELLLPCLPWPCGFVEGCVCFIGVLVCVNDRRASFPLLLTASRLRCNSIEHRNNNSLNDLQTPIAENRKLCCHPCIRLLRPRPRQQRGGGFAECNLASYATMDAA